MRFTASVAFTLLVAFVTAKAMTTEQRRIDDLFAAYATLEDEELWDGHTVANWRSSTLTGITQPDWEMFHPDHHTSANLGLVGHQRTRPSFGEIDNDGNQLIDRNEFEAYLHQMETMPPELVKAIELQHGIVVGQLARWAGNDAGWPWASDRDAARVISIERDYDGNIYAVVEGGGEVLGGPRDGSLIPGLPGRKVRISKLVPVAPEPEASREGLSADRVFSKLAGSDSQSAVLSLDECSDLGLPRMLKPAHWRLVERLGSMPYNLFFRLFDRYQFFPGLVAVAESARSEQQL